MAAPLELNRGDKDVAIAGIGAHERFARMGFELPNRLALRVRQYDNVAQGRYVKQILACCLAGLRSSVIRQVRYSCRVSRRRCWPSDRRLRSAAAGEQC